ncbi:uncharacterized protein [Bemisia tabaci]|uniref:uncharacterized protein n=1 Tax=Bemisia tabaci TaxID=7038 RepID=UPI003B282DDD
MLDIYVIINDRFPRVAICRGRGKVQKVNDNGDFWRFYKAFVEHKRGINRSKLRAPKSETATLTEGFSFKTGVGGGYGKLTPEKDVKSKQPGGSTTPVTERPLLKEGGRPSEVTSGKPRKSGSVPSTAEGLPIKTGEGKGYGKLRPEKDETPKQPAGSTTPISQRPLLKEGGRPSKETSGKPQKPGSVPVTTEEFTFPRPGEGAGYTRLNEKLEKPKELSGSQRPLLGEETEPPTETTSEMPRRRAGKAPVKEDSPEPITASYEKLEQTKDGTAVCRLGIFYPSTEDGEITEKECEVHCKTHFGKIVSSPEDSIDITEPGIYKFADITLGQICRCTFNYNRLKDYITNRLSEKDFYDFLNLACDDGFCAARVWLKDKKLKVEIEYEMEAKKQNSPVTASTLVTPQMSTTNTPDRSRTQTPSRTPIQSPFQSPFQSPPRTPDRFSMQTSKYSGGVDKSKGVAKSSTGTAIAPGTPYRSPMRTAPGTPDRFFTGGDASTYTVRTPPEEVLVGAFTTADGSYTMDMCVDSCRTAFGNILSPESAYTMRMPFTKAKLTADGKTCNCVLRSIVPTFCYDKYIRYSVLVKKIKKHFFCAGKVYIESSTRPKTNIEIEYEQAARPPHKKNKDKKPHYVRVSVGLDEQHENQNPGFDGVGEPSIIMRTFDKGESTNGFNSNDRSRGGRLKCRQTQN